MAKYIKPDSENGYIEDTAYINRTRFNNMRHSALGFTLGDFDETGRYVISEEIKNELIEMRKYIVDSDDNIEICHSELKLDKHITFLVTFEGNRATLSLLEKLNYEANFRFNIGAYSNINEYILDEVETSGLINKNAIYRRWNIGEFGGNTIDIFDCDEEALSKYFGLVNRFKYVLKANAILIEKEDEIENVEAEYSLAMFETLNQYPELKKAVNEQIKNTVSEKKDFVCLDKPHFAKTINEIIDKAVEDNIKVLSDEDKEKFESDRRAIVVDTNIKIENIVNTKFVDTDDEYIDETNEETTTHTPKIVVLDTNKDEQKNTIEDVAKEFSTAAKESQEKSKAKAKEIVNGTNVSPVAKVVEELVVIGVVINDIVVDTTIIITEEISNVENDSSVPQTKKEDTKSSEKSTGTKKDNLVKSASTRSTNNNEKGKAKGTSSQNNSKKPSTKTTDASTEIETQNQSTDSQQNPYFPPSTNNTSERQNNKNTQEQTNTNGFTVVYTPEDEIKKFIERGAKVNNRKNNDKNPYEVNSASEYSRNDKDNEFLLY